jgi:2-polyprenyl-3-methyl-5-hydroxy-6-metoxy-1,4-benzoquinol methylase
MIRQRVKRVSTEVGNRGRKLLSTLKPYQPMGQGKALLDAQYTAAEWDYLRSIGEAPRFGVVSAYCRLLASGGSVLEIGCGEGILLEHLDRSRFAHFTGVDISSVAIERARGLADERTTFACADAEAYVPDRAYDVIVFNEVLEYLDDPLAVVRRYEAFVQPEGHFVASGKGCRAGTSPPRTPRSRPAGVTCGTSRCFPYPRRRDSVCLQHGWRWAGRWGILRPTASAPTGEHADRGSASCCRPISVVSS